jgi:SpoIID/LytB domain protein
VAVSAALLPAGRASAGGSFTLYGSGWGHGLGLSQWGAYGLAKQGWNAKQILTHFYSGTKLDNAKEPPNEIRVALAAGEERIHLTAAGGPARLWAKAPSGKPIGTIALGATWVVKAVNGAYRVLDDAGAVVGGHDWGSATSNLYVTYANDGARVISPEGGATYNRGHLELNLTGCPDGCSLRLIVQLAFEEYLFGIGEVPSSWPMESLRAQAIAARSFALYKIRKYGLQESCNCNVWDGSNDQVYVGWDKEGGTDGHRWRKAATSTANEIVTYGGTVALTVFTASDGGHTEDLNVQWGTPLASYPYLAGVCDPGENTSANPWTDWSRSFSAGALTTALSPYTGDVGTISGFGKVRRGISGRIVDAVVHGGSGDATVTGGELRSALSLPDDRVWINADRNVLGDIRTKYDALMCEPGLPMSTTKTLAGGSRQVFATGAIYRNAEADATVWLKGAIYDEYLEVGGAPGTLGLPIGDPVNLAAVRGLSCPEGCSRVDFVNGRVFWKSGVGAHALWGDVLDAYLAHDGAAGALGFPTSRVQQEGGSGSATFEHGTISCAGDACQVTSG